MITAQHKQPWVAFWNWLSNRMIAAQFHEVKIKSDFKPDKRAILLLGNHISWWDGFWMIYANQRLFKKRYHVMMLEEELRKRMPFRHGGAFSIQKESRSLMTSLKYAGELLSHGQNLVNIFPEGEIRSIYRDRVHFEPGLMRILKYAPPGFRKVFSVALVDYGSNKKPTLSLYFEESQVMHDLEKLEEAYHQFRQRCKAQQIAEC